MWKQRHALEHGACCCNASLVQARRTCSRGGPLLVSKPPLVASALAQLASSGSLCSTTAQARDDNKLSALKGFPGSTIWTLLL